MIITGHWLFCIIHSEIQLYSMFILSSLFSFDENRATVRSEVLIKSNVQNTAQTQGTVSHPIILPLQEAENLPYPSHGVIRIGPATARFCYTSISNTNYCHKFVLLHANDLS